MRLFFFSMLMNVLVIGCLLLLTDQFLVILGLVETLHFVVLIHFLIYSKTRKAVLIGSCLVILACSLISSWHCDSVDLLNCDSNIPGLLAIAFAGNSFYFLGGFVATHWVLKRTVNGDREIER